LQHFIKYSDGTDGLEAGTARAMPLDFNLASENGKDVATMCINWVAQNMPGFEYPLKSQQLVSSSKSTCILGFVSMADLMLCSSTTASVI
jgi:hypothetical protein